MSNHAPDSETGLKGKLAKGQVVYSLSARLVRSGEIAVIARSAGYDTLYIDMEHGCFSLGEVSQICLACMGIGVAPLVRVPSIEPGLIGQVLDLGACGIIAPSVQSGSAARDLVKATRYPPHGVRSAAGTLPQFGYGRRSPQEISEYLEAHTTIIAMIESPQGVQAAEEIAATPGVNILLIGTNDLCHSYQQPGDYDSNIVKAAYERVLGACRQHGKFLGIGGLSSRPDLIKHYVSLGARYVSVGTDLGMLAGAARRSRESLG